MSNDGPTNADRALWALIGLQAFRDRTASLPADRDLTDPESFTEALSDLLCDLHHAADTYGGDVWALCQTRAQGHYADEVQA